MTAGPCRWSLPCEAAAVVQVQVASLDLTVAACTFHAQEHHDWVEHHRDREVLTPSAEPEPECWCVPDLDPEPVVYCPCHGTPEQRGLEDL